jgi:hypothetical protein
MPTKKAIDFQYGPKRILGFEMIERLSIGPRCSSLKLLAIQNGLNDKKKMIARKLFVITTR